MMKREPYKKMFIEWSLSDWLMVDDCLYARAHPRKKYDSERNITFPVRLVRDGKDKIFARNNYQKVWVLYDMSNSHLDNKETKESFTKMYVWLAPEEEYAKKKKSNHRKFGKARLEGPYLYYVA